MSEDARAPGDQPNDEPGDEGRAHASLGEFIRTRRKDAELSLRNLAKLAGVSNPYLSQIERGLRKPSAEILQGIAKALEVSSETLYVKAGILEERSEGQDVEAAIQRDPYLTSDQRTALIEMYRSLRRLAELTPRPPHRLRTVVDHVVDSVSTGAVDDDAVRRASLADEDVAEA